MNKTTYDCPNFTPEADNPYPLCDNPACTDKAVCNISAHMIETPYRRDCQ